MLNTQLLHYYKTPSPVGVYYHLHLVTLIDGEEHHILGTINDKLEPSTFRVQSGALLRTQAVTTASLGVLAAKLIKRELKGRSRLRRFAFSAIQAVVLASIISVVAINWLAYPECNRNNRDCFLIQNLWSNDNAEQ